MCDSELAHGQASDLRGKKKLTLLISKRNLIIIDR